MQDMPSALVVDDDRGFREGLADHLRTSGVRVITAADFDGMKRQLDEQAPDWVLFEPNLPPRHWHHVVTALAEHMRRGRWVAVTAFPSRALDDWAARTRLMVLLSKPVAAAQVHRVLVGEPAPLDPRRWPARPMTLARAEWEHLNHALAECEGNVSVAARQLAIPRQTLYRKLRTHPPLS
jgi:two-component system response regulator RegA